MSGDAPSDFARVYEDHVWRVYGFLAYRLRDHEDAEDLTQLTFERALRAWGRYDSRRASVSTWLLAIATNLLIDHRRRHRADPYADFAEDSLPAEPGPEGQGDVAPPLYDALAELDEREREVLALRYGADLSGAEVGRVLGLSPANVHQINSRALRRMRVLLERSEAPSP